MNTFTVMECMISIIFTIANAQTFTLSSWAQANGLLPLDFSSSGMCGYDPNTKELSILRGGTKIYSHHVQNDFISTLPSLSLSLTQGGTHYTQYDNVYFIQNYAFGTFNLNTKTITYPSSNLTLPVYSKVSCQQHVLFAVVGFFLLIYTMWT
eukprot:157028_1